MLGIIAHRLDVAVQEAGELLRFLKARAAIKMEAYFSPECREALMLRLQYHPGRAILAQPHGKHELGVFFAHLLTRYPEQNKNKLAGSQPAQAFAGWALYR